MVPSLFTDVLGDQSVISLRAMTEVQPKYVDPGTQQPSNHVLALASRAYRGDDLGAPQ